MDTTGYYVLQDDYPIQSLLEKTTVLEDKAGEWSIERILADPEAPSFKPLPADSTDLVGKHEVWLRVRILPLVDLENWWIIHKRQKDLGWVTRNNVGLYETWHTYESVYFVQDGQIIREAKTGTYIPASQKDITANISVNRVLADFHKDRPVDIYLHIKDDTWASLLIELRAPHIPLPGTQTPMAKSMSTMANFTFIISIYVLCFFFYTRDRSYLYLFGMLLFLFLHYKILHPEIPLITRFFPEYPFLREPIWAITTMGSYIFFMEFGRTFTNLRSVFPAGNKLINWCVRISLALLTLRLACWLIDPVLGTDLEFPFAMIIMLMSLSVVIRLAFLQDRLVRLYVYSGIWMFFFAIYGVLWEINILPFYDYPSPWMISQAGFMLLAALALAGKIQISERAKLEVEKVKAIDSVKSRFFANISHEFRTPLSLIIGPVNQALEAIPASESVEDQTEIPVKGRHLKVMKRNAHRLQNLVDQILDLSKLDQGKMELRVSEGDIIQFVRSIVFSFESLAERKHILFRTHFPQPIRRAFYDRDKLEKILVNLLSNAFKFTPEHGEVAVRVEDTGSTLRIFVSDTGCGMEAEEADRIFDRFYQVEGSRDQGTGIGLSLVKELVELHNGQIAVDSTAGKGTTFKVILPYLPDHFAAHQVIFTSEAGRSESALPAWLKEEAPEKDHSTPAEAEAPVVLIVEDNPDLRQYIAEQMESGFQILTAPDGEAGLQMAETVVPDLIISDVMMPRRTGLELCEAVKNNVKTSHIPIILLTAKADLEARIDGLQTGADDYLTKPFHGRELLIRAKNLIEQRANLRKKFAGELQLRPTSMHLNSMDEQFLQEVMQAIERNMDNEYFSVEDLAAAVSFSRSQLHRKLKALAGKSPNLLIREFRLTRAKELLEQQAASVSEIAFMVGYSNLSYFSRSFKDAFGVSPSEILPQQELSSINSKNPESP